MNADVSAVNQELDRGCQVLGEEQTSRSDELLVLAHAFALGQGLLRRLQRSPTAYRHWMYWTLASPAVLVWRG